MAEPDSTNLTALVLDEPERDLLERLIVNHAATTEGDDRTISLNLWERLAKDTCVIEDEERAGAKCTGCNITWDKDTRFVRVKPGCPVHSINE